MNSELDKYLNEEVQRGGAAYLRNLAAAEAAVLRGQFNLAKVLRALAHSQRVQALEAARLLDSYPDGSGLLSTILAELEYQVDLSRLDEFEKTQLEKQLAVRSSLKALLHRAVSSLESHSDVSEEDVAQMLWGCYGCGAIYEGNRPEVCQLCGAFGVEFEYFGPFYVVTREQLGRLTPEQIISTLRSMPDELAAAVEGSSEEVLSRKPAPKEWCAKEVIGHMAETHQLFAEKVQFLRQAQGMPVLDFKIPPWKTHEGKGYETYPIEELLKLFRQICQANLTQIENFTPQEWLRRGTVRGLVTNLLDYGTWLANHDRGHLIHVRQLCQLG
jgi:rubrerythrin